MKAFDQYIKNVRASGKRYFTTEQALSDLKTSRNALHSGIYRLKKKGDLISPARNLYVFVPPEYQNIGCIPAEELIPITMEHWGADYYAGLLTAAMYHGASHQKPQVFQVISSRRLKPLIFGKIKIQFIYKKSLAGLPVENIDAKTGYLKVSSPEVTAMDLLLYSHHVGGLNHVATILSELIEAVDSEKLIVVAKIVKQKIWIQRLGYILDHIHPVEEKKRDLVSRKLHDYLSHQRLSYMPLAAELPVKGASRSRKWMIIENTTIESDDDT